MPTLKPTQIRDEILQRKPNGDLYFTIEVCARQAGVAVDGDLIGHGSRAAGAGAAAQHFGARLEAIMREDDKRRATE